MSMCNVNSIVFQPPATLPSTANTLESLLEHKYVTKRKGTRLSTLYYDCGSKVTLLYSHGNAEDLSESRAFLRDFARRLGANIMAYDYSGYGLSDGSPSEAEVYDDADAMYEYVTTNLGKPPHSLILWGRSLGSGPTCYLAAKHDGEVGGVVIVSGFTSCFRTVIPSCVAHIMAPFDPFPNLKRISKVRRSHVLVMHGTNDQVVPLSHGEQLYNILAMHRGVDAECVWFQGRGHNDILSNRDSAGQYLTGMYSMVNVVKLKVERSSPG